MSSGKLLVMSARVAFGGHTGRGSWREDKWVAMVTGRERWGGHHGWPESASRDRARLRNGDPGGHARRLLRDVQFSAAV